MNFGASSQRSKPTFEEYLAGASLSFGIAYLGIEVSGAILSYKGIAPEELRPYATLGAVLYILLHLVSGWIGGYFVARRIDAGHLRAGFLTGVGAFLIEFFITLIFQPPFPGAIWVLICMLSGGLLGGATASLLRPHPG